MSSIGSPLTTALLATLAVFTAVLFVHDLVPLGRWNNVGRHPRRAWSDVLPHTAVNTAAGAVPAYLAWCSLDQHGFTPARQAIVIILGFVLLGELLSWWIPWLAGTSAARQRKLAAMTADTLSWVKPRHGITPNALHCVLHLLTVLALVETILVSRA